MTEKFLRVFKKMDVIAIKQQLLVYGDLGGACSHCNHLDVTLNDPVCPKCKTEFKYVAFRNPAVHMPKMLKLSEQRPSVTFIDYDDYKKSLGEIKAKEFLK